MMYLISYDIASTRVRTKVSKELLKAGLERVQYSVFIGNLSEVERIHLETKVEKLTAKETDFTILVLPLHNDMLQDLVEISSCKMDWEYLKGEKKILIL